jgi:hypothetical protein
VPDFLAISKMAHRVIPVRKFQAAGIPLLNRQVTQSGAQESLARELAWLSGFLLLE